MKILDVKIDNLTLGEVVQKIDRHIKYSKNTFSVTTINPEIFLLTQKNDRLKQAIIKSDLIVPDGTGVLWAAKKYKERIIEKIPGIDLIEELARHSSNKGWRWFLLGGQPGIAKKAANKLTTKYPGINIVKSLDPGNVNVNNLDNLNDLVKKIRQLNIDILVVSFGAPKQEIFIDHFKEKVGAKVCIGAGGSLDFISGKIKRSPKLLRKLGLEWFWRLILEPKRIKRIWNAVIKFPIAVKKDLRAKKQSTNNQSLVIDK